MKGYLFMVVEWSVVVVYYMMYLFLATIKGLNQVKTLMIIGYAEHARHHGISLSLSSHWTIVNWIRISGQRVVKIKIYCITLALYEKHSTHQHHPQLNFISLAPHTKNEHVCFLIIMLNIYN